jgi:hypothetical protein
MSDAGTAALSAALERLYRVFGSYRYPGSDFCDFCYTEPEIQRITGSDLRSLSEDDSRTLLWQTSNHWESPEVYKHYLPRILEVVGPPLFVEEIFTGHLTETLRALGFTRWPEEEKTAVIDYLLLITPFLALDSDEDRNEWGAGLAAIAGTA